jgi:NAD+ synthase (glutamine-hydrolysing)
MKIALAQLNYHIGNFESNIQKIIHAVQKAKKQKADLIVFAELAVSGYPPRDFLDFHDFTERCNDAISVIAKECIGIAAIVGGPSFNNHPKGKHLYNTAFFLEEEKIKSTIHKTLLPNYDVFDEYRYFEPNREFNLIHFKSKKIAVTICEDLWNISNDPLYIVNPMDELAKQKPDFIINIAASPFHYAQSEIRKNILKQNASKYKLPVFYVNHVGAQTELLFDGGSMAVDADGNIVEELNYFEEDLRIYDLRMTNESEKIQIIPLNPKAKIVNLKSPIPLIHDALVMGIRNYFQKLGFTKAILGLSGGIDSAVTLVLAAKALGNENVKAVLMPSQYSSEHSVKDAKYVT